VNKLGLLGISYYNPPPDNSTLIGIKNKTRKIVPDLTREPLGGSRRGWGIGEAGRANEGVRGASIGAKRSLNSIK
jgi:hypothetical protein